MISLFQFVCHNLQPVVNSIGLLFDIAGAIFVAWEVVVQFDGMRLKPMAGIATQDAWGTPVTIVPAAEETKEFKAWEVSKYLKMKIGLGCLIVGFIFQIASNWVPYFTAAN